MSEADLGLEAVAAVGGRGDCRSPRERARLAVVGVVDATMARGPSARGEQDLPASGIRAEPRLRRALPRAVFATPAEPPGGVPEHVDACPEVRDCVDVRASI